VSQPNDEKLDLKMKVLVVDDRPTMRKIIRNLCRLNGDKRATPIKDNILPQAIFWVKK